MFSMFLSSYRNTHESLGELKKAAFLVLPNFHECFYNSRARINETVAEPYQ